MIARRTTRGPVEPLSARVLRYRIARGYSASDLASAAGLYARAIRRLESGRSVDKRILAPLAAALGVPLCRLVCGEHSCAQRACVRTSRADAAPEPPRRRQVGAARLQTVRICSMKRVGTMPMSRVRTPSNELSSDCAMVHKYHLTAGLLRCSVSAPG